jgi:hypothetical protein
MCVITPPYYTRSSGETEPICPTIKGDCIVDVFPTFKGLPLLDKLDLSSFGRRKLYSLVFKNL